MQFRFAVHDSPPPWLSLDSLGDLATLYMDASNYISGVGLIGAVYAIILQQRQIRQQQQEIQRGRAETSRQFHNSLMMVAITDGDLAEFWQHRHKITSNAEMKRHLYANMLLNYWEMLFQHDEMTEDEVRTLISDQTTNPHFISFWGRARPHRAKIQDVGSKNKKSQMFFKICDEYFTTNVGLASRRSQPPLALAATVLLVPLSRFTSRVGGGCFLR